MSTKKELREIIKKQAETIHKQAETIRNLTEQNRQDQDDDIKSVLSFIQEEDDYETFDDVCQQRDDLQDEITLLHRQIDELQKILQRPPREPVRAKSKRDKKWKRPADYAKRYLNPWQVLKWNTDNTNQIEAIWDQQHERFIVTSTYEAGQKAFKDLKDVARYFEEKNCIPKGYNVWREFKDCYGKSVNRIDMKRIAKRRSRA